MRNFFKKIREQVDVILHKQSGIALLPSKWKTKFDRTDVTKFTLTTHSFSEKFGNIFSPSFPLFDLKCLNQKCDKNHGFLRFLSSCFPEGIGPSLIPFKSSHQTFQDDILQIVAMFKWKDVLKLHFHLFPAGFNQINTTSL